VLPPPWDPVTLTDADLDELNPDEQMGSKVKNWVRISGDDRRWLVKVARADERDGTIAGEDWAEWLVQHFAVLIGVPAATVRPAIFNGQRASVSRSMVAAGDELLHGNSLLEAAIPEYRQAVKGENPDYTPANVKIALSGVSSPEDAPELAAFSAFDVWSGYLLMDAWLAGQDRHDENWAAIRTAGALRLAPSFDHGNAIGFLLRDEERARRLAGPDGVYQWAARGQSKHFAGRPRLVVLAHDALGLAASHAREHWLARLDAVDLDDIASVTQQVPSATMSEAARTFVTRLLETNRRRLLDGYRSA
jgi:hypothetical protein